MADFRIFKVGGSCCRKRLVSYKGKVCMVKEIDKDNEGVENGYSKLYHEVQHMMKYSDSGLYPKIYNIDDTEKSYSVTMEYCYNGMTLADLIRNRNIDLLCFANAFSYIMADVINKLYSWHYDSPVIPNYIDQCYYNRAVNRLKLITDTELLIKNKFSDTLLRMIRDGFYVNQEYYPPVLKYIEFMKNNPYLEEELKVSFACHAHYDLCPMNILVDYDVETGKLNDYRMIDVRGEGETGTEKRNYMYDMGKMLLGLDAYDLVRIFNGRNAEESYRSCLNIDSGEIRIDFRFIKGGIAERYKSAQEYFWHFLEKNSFFTDTFLETPEKLKVKFLFSQCMMYIPDVPCRIISNEKEECSILIFLRGIIMMRHFLECVFGKDPVGDFNKPVNIWEGL